MTPLYVSARCDKLPSFRQDEIQRATQGITDSPREAAQREARHGVETGKAEYVYPPLPAARAPIAVSWHQVGVPERAPAPAVPPAEGPESKLLEQAKQKAELLRKQKRSVALELEKTLLKQKAELLRERQRLVALEFRLMEGQEGSDTDS
jgi:hypothetical protein